MAIDGLSLANINKFKDKESTEILSGAAKVAKEEAELTVEKVKESSEKEQEKQQSRKHELIKQEEEQLLEDQAEKQKKEEGKKFKVVYNKERNEIEIIDKNANYVIEALEPRDLVNILKKTQNPSGILANHRI